MHAEVAPVIGPEPHCSILFLSHPGLSTVPQLHGIRMHIVETRASEKGFVTLKLSSVGNQAHHLKLG